MAELKKGSLIDKNKSEERKNRRSIKDIKSTADQISGDFLELERPHKITFSITTADLLKLKSYCIKNKVKQQDKAYLVFKDWIDKEDNTI